MQAMNNTLKDKVLDELEARKGCFISGGALAAKLGVSRNAIWKAVHTLSEQGFRIESVTGKGYCLETNTSRLSASAIRKYLTHPDIVVEFHEQVDSTNNRCKQLASEGAPAGTLVVADSQSAGRGRQNRSFFSPPGCGIYFSLLLRPDNPINDIALVTSFSACAVADAIENLFGIDAQIKWVNDVFVSDRKVCGILSEGAFDAESGTLSSLVIGIGINVFEPTDGFPDDIASTVGAVLPSQVETADERARLVAHIASALMEHASDIVSHKHLDDYRRRSILDGREVEVQQGLERYRAHVIGIDEDFRLAVQLPDGSTRALNAGEVHIPSSQLSSSA